MYEGMSYKQLDALWFEKKRELDLNFGKSGAGAIRLEMENIRKQMNDLEAEWATPERIASSQLIHTGPLMRKCASCSRGILAQSKFCHVCGAAQG